MENGFDAAVVTVSDRCSQGLAVDAAGPAVAGLLEQNGFAVAEMRIVPDGMESVSAVLVELADKGYALVVTSGGTGLSPRDWTPEATEAVCERMVPGIGEAMRVASMKITSRGCLSRATAGVRGGTLVVNVPGSPKAAVENLEAVVKPIAHGLKMLRRGPADCAKTEHDGD
jgi:molybdenum cofactor synthesis domain-containing protein